MKKAVAVRAIVVSVLALALLGAETEAQTSVTLAVRDVTGSPFTYTPFTVATSGIFTFATNSPFPTDPILFLFFGRSTTGAGLGALRAFDDDAESSCGSANQSDSCIAGVQLFAAGDYTLAQGIFASSEQNARDNSRSDDELPFDVSYTTRITSRVGRLDIGTTATPEPASVLLLATGLMGVSGLARRKRTVQR